MRLFVAMHPGTAVVAAAQQAIAELRTRAATLAPGARITWIPPELMHLTVRFIGEVTEETAAAVATSLGHALPASPFTLEAAGVGAFSNHGAPRVIWGGLTSGTAELRRVERLVSERLTAVGIPPDDREFTPHLTLGRVRDAAGLRTGALLAGLDRVPLGSGLVDAITLFQSRLSPHGPTYVPLHRSVLSIDGVTN
ncbi:MAG: RNA 2',3'-cyclic phosphodiesterase [Vicinamibacterales bacterium]